jgi:hypothetical protein
MRGKPGDELIVVAIKSAIKKLNNKFPSLEYGLDKYVKVQILHIGEDKRIIYEIEQGLSDKAVVSIETAISKVANKYGATV